MEERRCLRTVHADRHVHRHPARLLLDQRYATTAALHAKLRVALREGMAPADTVRPGGLSPHRQERSQLRGSSSPDTSGPGVGRIRRRPSASGEPPRFRTPEPNKVRPEMGVGPVPVLLLSSVGKSPSPPRPGCPPHRHCWLTARPTRPDPPARLEAKQHASKCPVYDGSPRVPEGLNPHLGAS